MRRVVPAVVVGLICLAVWWWWPSERKQIRAQLERLATAVSVLEGESDLERMARVASLGSGLATDVSVQAAGRTLAGRDAVLVAARAAASAGRTFVVDIEDADITLAPDGAHADAHVVVRVDDDYQALSVSLLRADGVWLVDSVEADPPLRRPGTGAPR